MEWFKWLLVGYLGLSALMSVYKASKGKHQTTSTPGAQAFAALLLTLITVGIAIWL